MRARAEAIEHFAAVLRELRNSVGNPSFREMSGRSRAISHATLHEATRGNRLPSWGTTVEFVKVCGGDPAEFRERWEKANLAVRSVTTGGHPIVDGPADASTDEPADVSGAAPVGGDDPSGDGRSGDDVSGEVPKDTRLAEGLTDKGQPESVDRLAGEVREPDRFTGEVHEPDRGTDGDREPDWLAGEVLRADESADRNRPVVPVAGDVLLAVPASGRRRRFRPSRPVTAVSAAVVMGTVVISVVALNRGSFGSAGHALNPSGPTAEAVPSCPVHLPQPPAAPPAHQGDASIFVSDVTLTDCTHVEPGKTVTKVWRIKNIGTVPWQGYSLVRLDLPQRPGQCRTATNIPIGDTLPGEMADISTEVVMPGKSGLCFVRFKMLDASGTVAFPGKRSVNLQVIVDEP
ncbi:NBR1-Ig-like domain-containing protein [Spirillospora sp. NPDC052269]